MHREIPVKVNAWVDEGVAPLVLALNDFENVWTLASCEDDQSDAAQGAYVMFTYEGKPTEMTRFLADLTRRLDKSHSPHRLEVHRQPGEGNPLVTLSCSPDQVRDLARGLSAARS